ncbi:hypothetical protein J6TS7_59120 [Paenibacillus dendritiformis]|nr:hypothetical protein J6TS7_59120 [Paenibacillus dendritiformis]
MFEDSQKALIKTHSWKLYYHRDNSVQGNILAKVGLPTSQEVQEPPFLFKSNKYFLMNQETRGTSIYWNQSEKRVWTASSFDSQDVYPVIRVVDNALASSGNGDMNSPYVIDGRGEAVPSPGNFKATNVTSDSATLSWDSVPGADGYDLKRGNKIIYSGPETSNRDVGLSQDTSYTYSVVAKRAGVTGSAAIASVRTLKELVNPPTNFRVDNITDTSITLKWEGNGSDLQVLKRDGKIIFSDNGTVLKDEGLSPNTSYYYELVAKKNGAESSSVSVNATTAEENVEAPTGWTVTSATYNSIDMFWNAVPKADGYVLTRGGDVVYQGKATAFSNVGLEPDKEYSFTLKAVKGSVSSEEIFTVARTTSTDDLRPIIPDAGSVGFNVVDVGKDYISVRWLGVNGATGYKIKVGNDEKYDGNELMVKLEGLSEDTEYTLSLLAYNEYGNSNAAIITQKTLGSEPSSVEGLIVNRIYHDGASMQWKVTPGAKEYTLIRDNEYIVYTGPLTTYKDVTLSPETTYAYKVVASNEWGKSESDSVTVTTTKETPSIVITPTPEKPKEGTVTFSFKVIDGANVYYVERNPQWTYEINDDGSYHLSYFNTATGEKRDLGNVRATDGKLVLEEEGVSPSKDLHYDITAVKKNADGSETVVGGGEVDVTMPDDGSGITVPDKGVDPDNGGDNSNSGNTGGGNNSGADKGSTGGNNGSNNSNSGNNSDTDNNGSQGENNGDNSSSNKEKEGVSDNNGADKGDVDLEGKYAENDGFLKVPDNNDLSWIKDLASTCDNKGIGVTLNDLDKHWAKNEILAMVSRGVIKGFEDGTFKPDQSITRAEFTSIFMRTLCLGKVKADNKYSDVNSSAWYYNDVVTATELGLVEGIGQGKFDPNRNITRQEMSAVVSRFLAKAKLYPIPSETDVIPILDNFLDGKNVSDWAKTNVVHAIKAGLVKGNGNKIQPKKSATRGEVTALFSRMLTNLLSK